MVFLTKHLKQELSWTTVVLVPIVHSVFDKTFKTRPVQIYVYNPRIYQAEGRVAMRGSGQ